MAARSTFLTAAESFASLVTRLPDDLSGPGLGEWDLRALVGHTSRSLITVSTYLRQPVDSVEIDSAAEYYVAIAPMLAASSDSDDIAERGRAAGRVLGDDPAAAVRRLLDAVREDLDGAADDQLMTTIAGGMRLADYLPTRTFELVVHGLDIVAATGLDWAPPPEALAEALHLAVDVSLLGSSAEHLLRLVTGREPGGVSIV